MSDDGSQISAGFDEKTAVNATISESKEAPKSLSQASTGDRRIVDAEGRPVQEHEAPVSTFKALLLVLAPVLLIVAVYVSAHMSRADVTNPHHAASTVVTLNPEPLQKQLDSLNKLSRFTLKRYDRLIESLSAESRAAWVINGTSPESLTPYELQSIMHPYDPHIRRVDPSPPVGPHEITAEDYLPPPGTVPDPRLHPYMDGMYRYDLNAAPIRTGFPSFEDLVLGQNQSVATEGLYDLVQSFVGDDGLDVRLAEKSQARRTLNDTFDLHWGGVPTVGVGSGQPRRKIRVLVATLMMMGPMKTGGVGTAVLALVESLVRKGHLVDVLYMRGAKTMKKDMSCWVEYYRRKGVRVYCLPSHPVPLTPSAPTSLLTPSYNLYQWLKLYGHHYDVVHTHEWHAPAFYSVMAKHQGLHFHDITFITTIHCPDLFYLQGSQRYMHQYTDFSADVLERKSVQWSDIVVSPSRFMLEWVQHIGWSLPSRTFIQPNLLTESVLSRIPEWSVDNPRPIYTVRKDVIGAHMYRNPKMEIPKALSGLFARNPSDVPVDPVCVFYDVDGTHVQDKSTRGPVAQSTSSRVLPDCRQVYALPKDEWGAATDGQSLRRALQQLSGDKTEVPLVVSIDDQIISTLNYKFSDPIASKAPANQKPTAIMSHREKMNYYSGRNLPFLYSEKRVHDPGAFNLVLGEDGKLRRKTAEEHEAETRIAVDRPLEIVFFGRLERLKGFYIFMDALDRIAAHYEDVEKPKRRRYDEDEDDDFDDDDDFDASQYADPSLPWKGKKLYVTFMGSSNADSKKHAREIVADRVAKWSDPAKHFIEVRVISHFLQDDALDFLTFTGNSVKLTVLSSLMENSPYTILECMGLKIPFITSDTGGIPELIHSDDRKDVLFVPTVGVLFTRMMAILEKFYQNQAAFNHPDESQRSYLSVGRPSVEILANYETYVAFQESAVLVNSLQAVYQNCYRPSLSAVQDGTYTIDDLHGCIVKLYDADLNYHASLQFMESVTQRSMTTEGDWSIRNMQYSAKAEEEMMASENTFGEDDDDEEGLKKRFGGQDGSKGNDADADRRLHFEAIEGRTEDGDVEYVEQRTHAEEKAKTPADGFPDAAEFLGRGGHQKSIIMAAERKKKLENKRKVEHPEHRDVEYSDILAVSFHVHRDNVHNRPLAAYVNVTTGVRSLPWYKGSALFKALDMMHRYPWLIGSDPADNVHHNYAAVYANARNVRTPDTPRGQWPGFEYTSGELDAAKKMGDLSAAEASSVEASLHRTKEASKRASVLEVAERHGFGPTKVELLSAPDYWSAITSEYTSLPAISVVIPHHNRGGLFLPTVDSLLQQDYPEIEVVIVDDGSTDDASLQVLSFVDALISKKLQLPYEDDPEVTSFSTDQQSDSETESEPEPPVTYSTRFGDIEKHPLLPDYVDHEAFQYMYEGLSLKAKERLAMSNNGITLRIVRQRNLFPGRARNLGVAISTSPLVAFLDDDDLVLNDWLLTMVHVGTHTHADVVTCMCDMFLGDTRMPTSFTQRWLTIGSAPDLGFYRNVYGTYAALWRKDVMQHLGGYSVDVGSTYEDYEMFSEAVLSGFHLENVPEPLMLYRRRRPSNKKESLLADTPTYFNTWRGLRPYLRRVPREMRNALRFAFSRGFRIRELQEEIPDV